MSLKRSLVDRPATNVLLLRFKPSSEQGRSGALGHEALEIEGLSVGALVAQTNTFITGELQSEMVS